RALVAMGRARAQPVDAAMHVGVLSFIAMADGVDDGSRLLGARRAVEERQSLAVHLASEDGKVRSYAFQVERRRVGGGACRKGTARDGHAACSAPAAIQRPTRRSNTARTATSEMFSSASETNASTSMRRASAWLMPRVRR